MGDGVARCLFVGPFFFDVHRALGIRQILSGKRPAEEFQVTADHHALFHLPIE